MKIDKEKFRKLLYLKGFTQRSFSKEVGLAEVTINTYVMGKKSPKATTAKKMADVLGCSIEDLLDMRIDLMDITGQESGIVVYSNGNSIICNWAGKTGLPYVSPIGTGLIFLEVEGDVIEKKHVDDISPYVREILYDRNGDAEGLAATPGNLYTIKTAEDIVVIIAPEGWN